MFTGIIEETGKVKTIRKNRESLALTVTCKTILEDVRLGDSISVNGVCLTVTAFESDSFTVDVMPETFQATSLARLKPAAPVNLERAMAAGGRFGGHFVSGHVDGTGVIKNKREVENALYIDIELPAALMPFMMNKGSVAVDGTSLTIFGVGEQSITISLIPHTQDETILAGKRTGDLVNIEADMLAKYVEKMLASRGEDKLHKASGITEAKLKENGFYE